MDKASSNLIFHAIEKFVSAFAPPSRQVGMLVPARRPKNVDGSLTHPGNRWVLMYGGLAAAELSPYGGEMVP